MSWHQVHRVQNVTPAKSPKPGKPKYNIGQYNDTVLVDLGYVKDTENNTHGYMILVDDGTDWRVCQHIGSGHNTKTAAQLHQHVEDA